MEVWAWQLAVVRHLVELHGGTVVAESEGKGECGLHRHRSRRCRSRACVPLKGHRSRAALRRTPLGCTACGCSVVDDERDTCDTIGAVLEAEGAEVRTCLSAREALQLLDAWVPDILVSDIAMPGEDGYTLIRKIRTRKAEEGGRMLAVALTAYGSKDDRTRALSAGFQIHVGKPVEPDQLVGIVASVVRHRVELPHS